MLGEVERLRELSRDATQGEWMLATSCSWRRILTTSGERVIEPITQQSDNHPDLSCGLDHVNAELAIAAVNFLRSAAFEEMVRDAGRFRWLRENCHHNMNWSRTWPHAVIAIQWTDAESGKRLFTDKSGDGPGVIWLDKAVDHVMSMTAMSAEGAGNV
jgi:hypothetical protein